MINIIACSINLLKEMREDQMGTSDLELKLREEGKPNFCASCAMDLITCDCANPRPVWVIKKPEGCGKVGTGISLEDGE